VARRTLFALVAIACTKSTGAVAAAAAAQAAGAQQAAAAQGYHVVEVYNSETTTAEQLLGVLKELGADQEAAMPIIEKIDKKGKAVVVAGSEKACEEAAKAFNDIGMKTEVRPLAASDVPTPYDESDVIIAGSEELQELLETGAGVMVVFYAPWCKHCHTIVPDVKEAATQLKASGVRIAAIDGQSSPRTAASLGVRGYPTIMWLQKVKQEDGEDAIAMANYNGARDAPSLVKFATAANTAASMKSKLPQGESAATASVAGGDAAPAAAGTKPESKLGASKLGASKVGASKVAGGEGTAGAGVQKAKMPAEAAAEPTKPAQETEPSPIAA